jgi:nitrogen regulatory protein P-II 1
MKKLEFIIRPSKLEAVTDALSSFGAQGITVTHVTGCGLQKGKTEFYRGSSYHINLLPKVKLEVVLEDGAVDEAIKVIRNAAVTGEIGDGKIFVYPIENAVRIRTGEQGEAAIK